MDDTTAPPGPEHPDASEHHRDPRAAEDEDVHSGMSDDPRVDPTPDHRQTK